MNISNNIHGRSLIYGNREHRLVGDIGSASGMQQGNEYRNEKHRNAESDRNKRQDLYYRDISVGT